MSEREPTTGENATRRELTYTSREIASLRRQLRRGNAMVADEAAKRGYRLHPRLASVRVGVIVGENDA